MAIFRFMGYSNPLEQFLLLFIFMYIVFRSIAARKVHVYIHFTSFSALSIPFSTSKPFPYSINTHTYSYFAAFCHIACIYHIGILCHIVYHTGINI